MRVLVVEDSRSLADVLVEGLRDQGMAVDAAHDGLEAASATLMGQVTLSWDDERTSREALLVAMSRAGFRELAAV